MSTIKGSIAAQMDDTIRALAAGLRQDVDEGARYLQAELRAQARAAGFRDGGRALAGAWRRETFPRDGAGPRSLRPAALVWSKAPTLVDAFTSGAVITAQRRKYLAVPTEINRIRGRRGAGGARQMRVTPQEMIRSGRAFLRPAKGGSGVMLWCLRTEARTTRRGRLKVFGGRAELLTGRVKGLQARRQALAERGFVVMFILLKRATLRRRLDLAGPAARARARLAAAVRRRVGG